MKKQTFFSTVRNGRLSTDISRKVARCIASCEGKNIDITIERHSTTRSGQQNKYYHACVIPSQIDCFQERWGEVFTADDVHCWNKANIWCEEIIDKTGEIFRKPASSATKTKIEFENRLEKLRQFFELNFDWRIELPNENLKLKI